MQSNRETFSICTQVSNYPGAFSDTFGWTTGFCNIMQHKCRVRKRRLGFAVGLPSVRIATFRRDAPARCGAFADERRIAVGDDGGRVYREALISPLRSHGQRRQGHRLACAPLVASFAAFRCAAPACCGAFADERRAVVGDEVGRVQIRNAESSP